MNNGLKRLEYKDGGGNDRCENGKCGKRRGIAEWKFEIRIVL